MHVVELINIFLVCECLDCESLTGFDIHVLCQKWPYSKKSLQVCCLKSTKIWF